MGAVKEGTFIRKGLPRKRRCRFR